MLPVNAGTAAARTAKSYSSRLRLATRRCCSSRNRCCPNTAASFNTSRHDVETCIAEAPRVLIVCGDGWSIQSKADGERRVDMDERGGKARKTDEAKFAFCQAAYLRGAKPIRFGTVSWQISKSICLFAKSLGCG